MDNDDDDGLPVILAEWPKNAREMLRLKLDAYRGSAVVDLRCWYRAGAELKPGRAGITLSVKHLPALAEAMIAAIDEAIRRELLPPAD